MFLHCTERPFYVVQLTPIKLKCTHLHCEIKVKLVGAVIGKIFTMYVEPKIEYK